MPPSVYVSIARLIRDHARASEKPEEAAQRLFRTAAPEATALPAPVLAQWLRTVKWFVARAHDSRRVDAESNEDELRDKFELIERTLLSVARGFYTTLDELDAILEEANAGASK